METDVERTSVRTDATVAPEVVDVLDDLRWEQVELVECIRAASTRVSGASARVGFAVAGHARLTQQFFDAQRAILMRLATFDARAGEAYLRASDPFVERSSADLIVAQRELANLLDDWWATVNRHGESMMAHSVVRATNSLPPPMSLPVPLPLPPDALLPEVLTNSWAAPVAGPMRPAATTATTATVAPRAFPPPLLVDPAPADTRPSMTATAQLPATVVHALDHADVDRLDAVLASIADALRTGETDLSFGSDLGSASEDDLIVCLGPRSGEDVLAGLAILDHDRSASRNEGAFRGLVMRTVLPMIAATAALTTVMALLG